MLTVRHVLRSVTVLAGYSGGNGFPAGGGQELVWLSGGERNEIFLRGRARPWPPGRPASRAQTLSRASVTSSGRVSIESCPPGTMTGVRPIRAATSVPGRARARSSSLRMYPAGTPGW